MRSVPVRIYLPDGPVVQELAPPLMDDGLFQYYPNKRLFLTSPPGSAHTLGHFFSTHLKLLFPPRPPPPPPSRLNPNPKAPPAQELAFALIQGVVAPPEAELAWLSACLAGADGWLNICIGISRG
jgi:autophagy-related protein 5